MNPQVLSAPVPEGVDAQLWGKLVAELNRVVAKKGTAHRTNAVPGGPGSCVCDFGLYVAGGQTHYNWSYRLQGDYDLNGEANIADLTMIGLHYGKNSLSADWQVAQLADGDCNFEINIGDITPLGQNFGARLDGYELQRSPDSVSPYAMMTELPFVAGNPASGVYPPYAYAGPMSMAGPSFRVVPYVEGGGPREYGEPSNVYGPGNSVSSSWSTSRGNDWRDGLATVDGPAADGTSWSVDLGKWTELSIWAEPVSDPSGTMYIGTGELESLADMGPGRFFAVSPDGEIKWRFTTASSICVPAAISRTGHIIFGDFSGMIYCLAPDGKQFWRHQISGACLFYGALATDDGSSYIVAHAVNADLLGASTLYRLGPDGSIEWSRALNETCAGPPFYNADREVTVMDENGEIYSFDEAGAATYNFTMPDIPSGYLFGKPPTIRGTTIGYATDFERVRAHGYDNSFTFAIDTTGEEPTTMPAVNRDDRIVFVTRETGSTEQLHLNCYYGVIEEWDIGLPGNVATIAAIDAQNRSYVGTYLYGSGITTGNGISCVLPDQTVAWFHPTGTDWPLSVIVADDGLVVSTVITVGSSTPTMMLIGIRE